MKEDEDKESYLILNELASHGKKYRCVVRVNIETLEAKE